MVKTIPAKTAAAACVVLAGILAVLAGGCWSPASPKAEISVPVERSGWAKGGVAGQLLTTRHYCIYTNADNRQLVKLLPAFMEKAYNNYLEITGLADARASTQMPIYMLGNRLQWSAMTEQMTEGDPVFQAIENGGYCYRGVCVFWDLTDVATYSISSHEGFHQFLFHRLKDPLPAWADEGLAVTSEGFKITKDRIVFTPGRNPGRMNDLRNLIANGRLVPLEKILGMDAGDNVEQSPFTPSEYYGQLWALLAFIRSQPGYRAGLDRMIADAAGGELRKGLNVPAEMGAGRTYVRSIAVPAFQKYISEDLKGFDRQFQLYAHRLAKL